MISNLNFKHGFVPGGFPTFALVTWDGMTDQEIRVVYIGLRDALDLDVRIGRDEIYVDGIYIANLSPEPAIYIQIVTAVITGILGALRMEKE